MKSSMLVSALSAATLAYSHGLPKTMSAGGEEYTLFNPYYDLYTAAGREEGYTPEAVSWITPGNGPIEDVTLDFMACNGNDTRPTAPGKRYAKAAAGSDISITWDTWPSGHKGPLMTYMASCGGDCRDADPTALEFFKIFHDGLHADLTTWATDDLIANGLTHTATIPADIKPGNYLLRHEILALHTPNGPQFYPVCINLEISGSGSAVPEDTVKFPGAYAKEDPGVSLNIYYPPLEGYTIPGPAVYKADSSAAAPASSSKAATSAAASSAAESSAVESSAAAPSSAAADAASTAASSPTYVSIEIISSAPSSSTPSSTVAPIESVIPVASGTAPIAPSGTAPSSGSGPGGNYGNYGPGPAQTLAPSLVPGPATAAPSGDSVVTATYVQTIVQTAVITMTKTVAETETVTVTPTEGVVCTTVGRYRHHALW
ncbi:glycosyl hydrolase family 61-domain-containing protein [Geopyxis carbonaria]|nr:glycosyl hydrolase family 61-domain-containing protein [Geopyxis carbonaria]